jgi:hypothetical protein
VWSVAGAKSTLTTTPKNTAVNSGNAATFQCTTNSTRGSENLSWKFGNTLIVSGCSGASAPYSVDKSNPGQCNLIVNPTNSTVSGSYSCVELSSLYSFSALLTVIGKFLFLFIIHTQNVIIFYY